MTTRPSAFRLVVVTALVGVGGGVAGVAVYLLLQLVQFAAFGFPFRDEREAADAGSALVRFLAVLAAGVLCAVAWWALRRWGARDPAQRVVGVVLAVRGERMPARVTVANAAVQIVAVGLGASIGKEVAPRELGALLAQRITARAGLTPRQTRVLVACGAASGLAAVYDVPIAGALFALEVLLAELTIGAALPALATSAIAALVARAVIPVETLYRVPAPHFSVSLLVWSAVAGPLLGLAGAGFATAAARAGRLAPKGRRILIAMPVAFAAVGVAAIWFPWILGNGRAQGVLAMNLRLDGHTVAGLAPLLLPLVLALLKTTATIGTIGSGAVGGTLSPSIAIGAALGAFLGGLWCLAWPGAGLVGFAMIGAAAFLATTMRAPLTALALVVEFTGQGLEILAPALLAIGGAVGVGVLLRQRRLAGVEE